MEEPIPSPENEPKTPSAMTEDSRQFMQWMVEYGRPALIGLAVAVVVLLGISIWRNQKEAKSAAAVQALFQSQSPEELLQLATADPKAPTAPMALASAAAEFYSQNRYDEALTTYQQFLTQYPSNMLFADAELGVAASQEALDDFETAATSYEAFAAANPDSPLQPQAVMGAARCRVQLGQFDEARALYEDFMVAQPDSSWMPQAESGLLFLKKAERAKNLPVVAPEVVYQMGTEPVKEVEDTAVMAENSVPPVVTEEAVTTEAAPVVAAEAAPAAEKASATSAEPKTKQKKTAQKKKAKEPQAEPADAGEPAAE